MKTLLAVEARRFLARRIVRSVAAVTLFGMMLAGAVLFVRSHHPAASSTTGRAAIQRALQEEYDRDVTRCTKAMRPSDIPPGRTAQEFCEDIVPFPIIRDPEFHLTHYRDVAGGLSGLFIAVLVVLGATSAGAEWHAGTVTTQLTWEPRRTRLLLAKVLVVALAGFLGFWLAEALLFGALAPAAVLRGSTDGVDGTWLGGTAAILLRASAVAAMGAAVGHALAWTARNTAVAVGLVLGYAAVLEPLLHGVRPRWEPWLVVSNAFRFITTRPIDVTTRTRSTVGAGLLLMAYTLAVVVISVGSFRRRDVT
jgi:hypothetical protein